jgi:hypothetical protein
VFGIRTPRGWLCLAVQIMGEPGAFDFRALGLLLPASDDRSRRAC